MKYFKIIIKYSVIILIVVCILDIAIIVIVANLKLKIEHAQSIIVLGAAINTPALYNRTLEGLNQFEQGKADVMVLSGGKIAESDISEAQYMEKVIKANANKKITYIIEDHSTSTYENIRYSKIALADKTDSVIIVSDKFHLARAFLMAKRQGFKRVYWSSPDPKYYSERELNYYYIREFVAILSYIPKFILG